MTRARHWKLRPRTDLAALCNILCSTFTAEPGSQEDLLVECLDSFGWDVWHSGALLVRDGSGRLQLLGSEETIGKVAAAEARYWWQLPEGELRARLRSLLGYWSFNPVALLTLQRVTLDLRNDDQKIVVRGLLTWHAGEAKQTYLSLIPLRGYEKELRVAARLIDDLAQKPLDALDYRTLLEDQGCQPHRLESRPVFGIAPETATEGSVRQMAQRMAEYARQFEGGVMDDTDTEFLHQYRVSLRKTRSLISLMKAALSAETFMRIKRDLGELVAPTGNLRDLDVFLLDRGYYSGLLPAEFGDGFSALSDHLESERRAALKRVQEWFTSPAYQRQYTRVLEQLAQAPQLQGRLSGEPIQPVVNRKILARYRKIVKIGSRINRHTPDDEVHLLRIECKKLRYLMEFFAEFYPREEIEALIGELKQLQDILGKFNDFSVQIEFLMAHLSDPERTPPQAAAIGGLVGLLHQRQAKARKKVRRAFADFARKDISRRFESCFGQSFSRTAEGHDA